MFSIKNMTIGFFVMLILGFSLWSIFISKHSTHGMAEEKAHRPDALMENVVATVINNQGQMSMKIESPKMTHYPDHDMTTIDTPHIVLYRHSPEPWHINALHAKATQGLDKIYFWENVIIRHLNDTANPTTTMTTNTLTVFPDKQLAQTNDHVTVIQPSTTINGLGMLADLNKGTVQLLSQAQGDYVPNAAS